MDGTELFESTRLSQGVACKRISIKKAITLIVTVYCLKGHCNYKGKVLISISQCIVAPLGYGAIFGIK